MDYIGLVLLLCSEFSTSSLSADAATGRAYIAVEPVDGVADTASQPLRVPASELLPGSGFYGRGWTGVTPSTPGGTAC